MEYPSGTTVNASITHIPCNTNCKVSVSTSAWDTSFSNTVTCSDNANQTFKSAGVGGSSEVVSKAAYLIMYLLHLHCSPLSSSSNRRLEKELHWKRCDAVCLCEYLSIMWVLD